MILQEIPVEECGRAVLPILLEKGVELERACDIALCAREVVSNAKLHGGDGVVVLGIEVACDGIFIQIESDSQWEHSDKIEEAIDHRINKGVKPDFSGKSPFLNQGLAIACQWSERIGIDKYGRLVMAFGTA